ncbi:MAG: hypothetical protein ACRENK_08870 [Gemmatimonadaceae bacterium]
MYRNSFASLSRLTGAAALVVWGAIGCSSSVDNTDTGSPDVLKLTAAQISSLDSSGHEITNANPGNADLKSLVDSALLVLTAGVEAKRVDVATNLTTAALYFVGIHRAYSRVQGSFSTWTVVGMDDPSHLANLVEVGGFAQNGGSVAPSSVSGTIGDGAGVVNALLLQVGNAGAVTEWNASSGSASFSSGLPGEACPGFTPTPIVTCALETMTVRFSANASSGGGGADGRQAAVTTDVTVPALRLSYTP